MMLLKKQIEIVIVFFVGFSIFLRFGGGVFHVIPSIIALLISVLLACYLSISKGRISFGLPLSLVVINLIFIFLLFFSLLWTKAINYGLYKSLWISIYIVSYILVAQYLRRHLSAFILVNVIFGILFTISLLIEYSSIPSIISNLHEDFRLGGTEVDSDNFTTIGLSRYIAFVLICTLFLIRTLPSFSFLKIVLYGNILISILFLFLSGSRGPILSLIVVLFFHMLMHGKHMARGIILSVLSLLLVVSLSRYFNESGNLSEFYVARYQNIHDEGRFDMQARTLKKTSEHFILGAGVGNFGDFYINKDIKIFPHNIFVEIAYENGLLGLILFLMILLYRFGQNISSNGIQEQQFAFWSFIYFLINAQFSGDITNNSHIFLFILIMNVKNFDNN